jgi:penicillin-binding protein 2
MGILRRDNHRRYGSQRLEYRRFGTPTKDAPKERSADEVFLGRRMFIFKSMAAGCFAAMTGRIGYLQLGHHQSATTDAVTQNLRKQVVKAPRGLITDRNGTVLAENVKAWGLALIRSKLPTDPARREAMFAEVEKYVPLEWAITVLPLGPRALPDDVDALAKRLAPFSTTYDDVNIGRMLVRANQQPILIEKTLAKEEVAPIKRAIGDVPGIQFLRYAEYLVSPANQPDATRPTLVKRGLERYVALALDANVLDFPGMVVDETVLARHYPLGDLVSHIVGYVGPVITEDLRDDPITHQPIYQPDDVIGRMGIEAALEEEMRGVEGTRVYLVDSQEVDRGTSQLLPATPGKNLQLTIDVNLQRAVQDALKKQLPKAEAAARDVDPSASVNSAVAVVLDPRNGEILAMVSLPAYDNQVFIDSANNIAARNQVKAYLDDNTTKPMLNKALYELYAPGSTLKPFMAAGGLQEGTLKPDTTFNCPGAIYVQYGTDENTRDKKPCWTDAHHIAPHGPQTVVEGIMNSCDIFFYNVGAPHQIDPETDKYLHYYEYLPTGVQKHDFQGLGIEAMDKYFTDFGFGAKTGLTDLSDEEVGIVPTPAYKTNLTKKDHPPNGDPWALGDTINVTIGQGYFTCTPLQMAVATAAIANGGNFYRPHLVRTVTDENGQVVRTAETTPLRHLLVADEHLALVRQGMHAVINDKRGTAFGKFITPVEVAGKTGTAEYGDAIAVKGQPLAYQRQHAWFTAYAPYDNPEVVVAVLIVGGGEGTTFAAPAAGDILNAYFNGKAKTGGP